MSRDRVPLPVVDPERCTGCGWCVAVCPPKVLSLQSAQGVKRAHLHDVPGCTGCSRCEPRCPFGAIRMAVPSAKDRPSLA